MELREYLFKNRIKGTDFAKIIGYNHNYICAISRGVVSPGKKMAKAIEEATKGQVVYKPRKFKCDQMEAKDKSGYRRLQHSKVSTKGTLRVGSGRDDHS
jgi:hypothetical protein